MLLPRVLSALVAIPLALAAVLLGDLYLTGLLLLLAVIAVHELLAAARQHGLSPSPTLAQACAAATIGLTHSLSRGRPAGPEVAEGFLAIWFALVMGSLLAALARYHRDQSLPVTASVGATVLAAGYVGVTFSGFVLARAWQVPPGAEPGWGLDQGSRLLFLILFSTWATDTGAYFVGKRFGRRPLTPASPKKTVEGTLGGLACAGLTGLAAGAGLGLGLGLGVGVGLLCGVAGQLGDLAKSILKRDLGVKDFGRLMPGHGGVLDRLDSLMMNVPLVYLAVRLFG